MRPLAIAEERKTPNYQSNHILKQSGKEKMHKEVCNVCTCKCGSMYTYIHVHVHVYVHVHVMLHVQFLYIYANKHTSIHVKSMHSCACTRMC